MQTYVEAKFTDREGRALWLAMLDDVKSRQLMAPAFARTLAKLGMLFVLLGAALWLAWFGASWLELGAGYAGLSPAELPLA